MPADNWNIKNIFHIRVLKYFCCQFWVLRPGTIMEILDTRPGLGWLEDTWRLSYLMLMRYWARATLSALPVMVMVLSRLAGASLSSQLEILIIAPDSCLQRKKILASNKKRKRNWKISFLYDGKLMKMLKDVSDICNSKSWALLSWHVLYTQFVENGNANSSWERLHRYYYLR